MEAVGTADHFNLLNCILNGLPSMFGSQGHLKKEFMTYRNFEKIVFPVA